MAKILKANGEEIEVIPANGKKFTDEELDKVMGGYVVPVSVFNSDYADKFMWKVDCDRTDGFNKKATDIVVAFPVYGDVLLCDRSELD